MDFWNKLTKKASETYKGASEKTNKIARETKLKLKINDNKSKIEDLYTEIGKKVYQKHVANQELINVKEDIHEECEKIDNLGNEIEVFEKEIWELKDNKQCPNCKSKISKDDAFCPNCGAKQEIEETKEPEVVEEAIKEDSTEDNNELKEDKTAQDDEVKEKNEDKKEDNNK